MPTLSKLPGADISHQLGPKSKHQERRTEVKIHGDSRRVYLLLSLLFLSTPSPIPAPSPAREIRVKFTCGVDFSWQTQVLLALQEAAEAFLVPLFEDACLLSLHAGRVTLSSKDAQLAGKIGGLHKGHGWAPGTSPCLWWIPEPLPVAWTRSTGYKVLPALAVFEQCVSCFPS